MNTRHSLPLLTASVAASLFLPELFRVFFVVLDPFLDLLEGYVADGHGGCRLEKDAVLAQFH